MTRMTRAESQAHTRSQLLVTARRMFFEDGYHPTSLEKVADAAGYSKGAVYSNFRNKDELCAAVLDEIRAERLTEVLGLVSQPDRFDAIRDWAQRVIGDPGWTSLEAEFALHARSNDQLRTELAGRLDAIIQMLANGIESAADLDVGMPSREAATVMLALGVGLGLMRSVDPSVPVNGLVDTLRLVAGQPI
ncbi:TetR/AcrR family transcriptional regulator [Mycolicibacterium stellerae]|uniref:TetR/AcrR family transcriptional regulator n=1 Tax=Mycolicibacterium stellerae TaxID=2358193 RepID=UPI0013DDF74C|nr:TetR/AcrR family transcriptional regulator [Mycolicibacterium stellerae]